MLMLMSLSSIATFYFSFLEVVFTLTSGIVNVGFISTRAYISQCEGKTLFKFAIVNVNVELSFAIVNVNVNVN